MKRRRLMKACEANESETWDLQTPMTNRLRSKCASGS